jgi:cytochrome c2
MGRRGKTIAIFAVAAAILSGAAINRSWAGDALAGKAIFERICHACHTALPYIGRIGEANLPLFLANPRRFNPRTAMTFPGLQKKKDIDDVIAFITGPR